jgi:hypothetical protein
VTDISLDEFLRRRAKLVRVTDRVNEKICRGLFQTLYWRRAFLARRSATSSFTGTCPILMYLITVPAIVVQESDAPVLSIPRPSLPSLDLTQMRDDMGEGYSSGFEGQDRLQPSYSQQSDVQDEGSSPGRSWSTIGGPDSQIALSGENSELYIPKIPISNNRSHEMDENEAIQLVQSLTQSAWRGAIPAGSTSKGGRPAESDQE